jgi:hypothetical protein
MRFTHIFTVSGSGGTHAGLLAGLHLVRSKAELLGVTVSRPAALQRPVVEALIDAVAPLAGADAASAKAAIDLDDSMYLPATGCQTPPRTRQSSPAPGPRVSCSTRSTPRKRWPPCAARSGRGGSRPRTRYYSCTLAGRRRCSPTPTSSVRARREPVFRGRWQLGRG